MVCVVYLCQGFQVRIFDLVRVPLLDQFLVGGSDLLFSRTFTQLQHLQLKMSHSLL